MLTYLLFGVGLVLLLLGGDWLVKGAVGLAEKFAVSPLIIGLTIVAFGTSAPELIISVEAALLGSAGIAVGNVVGSNIANVLLVVGLPAIISPIRNRDNAITNTLIFLVVLTAIFMLQMYWSPLERIDGIGLLLILTGFLTWQFVNARTAHDPGEDYHDEIGRIPSSGKTIAALLIAGLVALPIGATLTIDAAVDIARRWSVAEEVIGLTIVAIGTSLPELATGVMAARHNNSSVAIGNVVGSNLFNIAAIMGATATLAGTVDVGSHIVSFDMWLMMAVTLFLVAITVMKLTIGKTGGILLLCAYLAYLITTSLL